MALSILFVWRGFIWWAFFRGPRIRRYRVRLIDQSICLLPICLFNWGIDRIEPLFCFQKYLFILNWGLDRVEPLPKWFFLLRSCSIRTLFFGSKKYLFFVFWVRFFVGLEIVRNYIFMILGSNKKNGKSEKSVENRPKAARSAIFSVSAARAVRPWK